VSEQKVYRILQVVFIAAMLACAITAGVLYANGTATLKERHAAWLLLRSHDYAAAVTALEECAERRPWSSDNWMRLAIARFHTGDYEGAASALRASWSTMDQGDVGETGPRLAYLHALANDELPGDMLPSVFTLYAEGKPPDEYRAAWRDLRPGTYAEAAAGFEACLGRMPGTPGEADALWGLAAARFHMGSYDGALEAIERIRAGSDRPPSREFEGVVAYIKAVAEGRSPSEPMPWVLRRYAPRQKG
jgi:tetratricopeptide (TPR) repeat protein